MSDADAPSTLPALRAGLLRVAYADAAPLAAGAWRLTIGFAPGASSRGPVRPPPPEALRFRAVDGPAHATLLAVRTRWIEPGRVLAADVDLFGSSTAAGRHLLRIDCPDLVDPEAAVARFDAPETRTDSVPAVAALDYLTKDYAGFRHLMLGTIGRHLPRWSEANEADIGVTIVESLAYGADFLSYRQDAVATEAYLDTARQRTSVRRHLRLLGYRLSEGCAGRVLLHLAATPGEPFVVPAGTAYIPAPDLPSVANAGDRSVARLLADGRPVYTQIAGLVLEPAFNRLGLAAPGGLRPGCRHVPVLSHAPAEVMRAAAGRLFAIDGTAAAPNAAMHPFWVRSVTAQGPSGSGAPSLYVLEADPADALPFEIGPGAAVIGNLVPTEFGRLVRGERLPLPSLDGPFRPILAEADVVPVVPVDPLASAATLLAPDPGEAVAAVTLREIPLPGTGLDTAIGSRRWQPATDLLACSASARRFVVETGEDGSTTIRFGDGVFGRAPPTEARLIADYRVGALSAAPVGAGQLDTLVAPSVALFEALRSRLIRVSNPIPSKGLRYAEPETRAILHGKADFRIVRTCATLADFAAAAEAVPGVAEAVASVRRIGAVEVVEVRLRAVATLFVAEPLLGAVRAEIAGRMLPGRRLAVLGPRFARVSIGLAIRPHRGSDAERLRREVETALSAEGLFAPRNLAFGRPVFASRILQAAAAVPGVASAEVTRLARAGSADTAPAASLLTAVDEIPVVADLRIALEAAP